MAVELVQIELSSDTEALIEFLTENDFPFHVGARLTREHAVGLIAAGRCRPPQSLGFWIEAGVEQRVGYVEFRDLEDTTADLDLRLGSSHRGQGLGTAALQLGTTAIFNALPHLARIEGTTREDNLAMRRVFEKSGYVKEAYYRDGWEVEGSEPMAAVGYAILRRDWLSGDTTPVQWGT